MEYKDAIDMIKNIDNDRYRNYKKADFIEDFIMTKGKYSLSNILFIADEDGRTIAHVMVSIRHKLPQKLPLLKVVVVHLYCLLSLSSC